MSFKEYLQAQITRKDSIGDLAKKITKRKFVKYSYEDIYSYLYSTSASEEEIHALKAVFEEYNMLNNSSK
ncbi:MAG TPA: hypothetical protein VD908_14165 [Cytophagales bacterium]|nr:hypothetical protein [Cytophagales bacterium]